MILNEGAFAGGVAEFLRQFEVIESKVLAAVGGKALEFLLQIRLIFRKIGEGFKQGVKVVYAEGPTGRDNVKLTNINGILHPASKPGPGAEPRGDLLIDEAVVACGVATDHRADVLVISLRFRGYNLLKGIHDRVGKILRQPVEVRPVEGVGADGDFRYEHGLELEEVGKLLFTKTGGPSFAIGNLRVFGAVAIMALNGGAVRIEEPLIPVVGTVFWGKESTLPRIGGNIQARKELIEFGLKRFLVGLYRGVVIEDVSDMSINAPAEERGVVGVYPFGSLVGEEFGSHEAAAVNDGLGDIGGQHIVGRVVAVALRGAASGDGRERRFAVEELSFYFCHNIYFSEKPSHNKHITKITKLLHSGNLPVDIIS